MLRIIASQYLANLILGFTNAATVQPVIAIERPVFYRERGAGALAPQRPAVTLAATQCGQFTIRLA